MRKITQIAACINETQDVVYALCDDGTLWGSWNGIWHEMDGVPQPHTNHRRMETVEDDEPEENLNN